MTTPSEPRAEDLRSDPLEVPLAGAVDPEADADLVSTEPASLRQGAEPTTEDSPGELPDESMGPA